VAMGALRRRRGRAAGVLSLLVVLALLSSSCAELSNARVKRVIQIFTNIARISTTYTVTGVGDGSDDDRYLIALPLSDMGHLAQLTVFSADKKKTLQYQVAGEEEGYALYSVPVAGPGEVVLDVMAVYTDVIRPFPAEIFQMDPQMVMYEGTSRVPSPYRTSLQSTTVQMKTTQVESYSGSEPIRSESGSLALGPYSEAEPFDVGEPLRVHYVNHAAFAKVINCLREIEVSHWGNIAVEEMYDLEHHGAKLKGGFSRMDYQAGRQQYVENPSFRELAAILPSGARDIYYRDQIGNVSTSAVLPSKKALQLSIATRYPMFGGWKTSWYQGYNLDSEAGLSHKGSNYQLNMKFGMPFSALWAEDLTVKVVLPEGARNISVSVPFDVESSQTRRFTYLDTPFLGGRPVIVLHKQNVVSEHNLNFQVTYSFHEPLMLVEPLVLAGAAFAFFFMCMIAARLDLRIRPTEQAKSKPRSKKKPPSEPTKAD
jgi:oligosaccharyltransferase complex subunit alpha (ribophorin I)